MNLWKPFLCEIRRCLLDDVYSFAGHYRREDIAKGNTRFLCDLEMDEKLLSVLQALHNGQFLQGLDISKLIERSAWYLSELNDIHPFRECKGRVLRECMRLLYL